MIQKKTFKSDAEFNTFFAQQDGKVKILFVHLFNNEVLKITEIHVIFTSDSSFFVDGRPLL